MSQIDFQSCPFPRATKITVFVLLFILSGSGFSQPQSIYFDHLTIEEGLSQNDINCILQDHKGFMWFGTNDGLNRFDGYEFDIFKPDPGNSNSISSNLILSLAEDSLSRLWIGTVGAGLSCLDPHSNSFFHYKNEPGNPESLSNNHIRSLLVDHNGHLWVGTINGLDLFMFDSTTNKKASPVLIKKPTPALLSSEYIEKVYQATDKKIWIGTRNGLFLIESPLEPGQESSIKKIPLPYLGSDQNVRSVTQDKEGNLLVVSALGLMYQIGSDSEGIPLFERISTQFYSEITVDTFNQLWASGVDGLHQFRKSKSDSLPQLTNSYNYNLQDPHSLNKDVLRTLYTDKNGLIWVGTNGGGLNKFDPEKISFRHFKKNLHPGSISYDKIRVVFQDSEGNIWMGTEGGGFNFLPADQDDGNYESFSHISRPNYIFAMAEVQKANKKNLYFGGQSSPGLYKIKIPKNTSEFQPENIITISEISSSVFAILNDNNDYLWVGTYNGGLFRMNLNSPTNEDLMRYRYDPQNPKSLSNDIIRSLLKDSQGNIWIGTGNGLNKISQLSDSNQNFIRYYHDPEDLNSLSHNYILALYESENGEIWIGTFGGGLNKFIPGKNGAPDRFQRITESDGLANNVIKGILEDSEGNLWVSSNKGLTRMNLQSQSFKNYDTNDGLQSKEFSELACLKKKNGEMIFGGVNGFNAFFPERFRDNPSLPEVVFYRIASFK